MYIDYLRVVATIAVIMIHVSAKNWYTADVSTFEWKVYNFYDSISRWSVPIFVMISGALFLNRNEINIKDLFFKYILRLCVAYGVWSFVYYLSSGESIQNQIINLWSMDACVQLFNGEYHMWYIPMMIGIYIAMPLLKYMTKNEKIMNYFLWISLFVVVLIPSFTTIINDFCGDRVAFFVNSAYRLMEEFDLTLFMSYSFYFVLGYKLSHMTVLKSQKFIFYFMGIACMMVTMLLTWVVSCRNGTPISNYYNYSSINVFGESVFIFMLFKNLSFSNRKINELVAKFSKWSFGIYLVHILVFSKFLKHLGDMNSILVLFAIPVVVLLVFLCSSVISGILNIIPGIRRYIV